MTVWKTLETHVDRMLFVATRHREAGLDRAEVSMKTQSLVLLFQRKHQRCKKHSIHYGCISTWESMPAPVSVTSLENMHIPLASVDTRPIPSKSHRRIRAADLISFGHERDDHDKRSDDESAYPLEAATTSDRLTRRDGYRACQEQSRCPRDASYNGLH